MATDLQECKIELIQWLSVIDDIALLKSIAEIKEQSESDWWDDISDREKASIDKGIADADAQRLNFHSAARGIYGKQP